MMMAHPVGVIMLDIHGVVNGIQIVLRVLPEDRLRTHMAEIPGGTAQVGWINGLFEWCLFLVMLGKLHIQ